MGEVASPGEQVMANSGDVCPALVSRDAGPAVGLGLGLSLGLGLGLGHRLGQGRRW